MRTSSKLTSLEFGGTAVTSDGLVQLYTAAGTRPFDYLGFEYTDKMLIQRMQWGLFGRNPVRQSIAHLHKAKHLKEVVFTGNSLDDNDMATLVENVLQTNITTLTLFNNKISPKGVERLLPLTRQLETLDLGINWRIGNAGAILLANALKDPSATLTRLTLFNSWVGQKGADAFLSIFPNNTKLTSLSLDLARGSTREETVVAIRENLARNF